MESSSYDENASILEEYADMIRNGRIKAHFFIGLVDDEHVAYAASVNGKLVYVAQQHLAEQLRRLLTQINEF